MTGPQHVRTPECPAWCTAHAPLDLDGGATVHQATVTVGLTSLTVEQTGDGRKVADNDPEGAAIIPDDLEWVNGQDAHDFAEAMRQAAQLVHPLGGDES